jgi:hypothetical protein
MPVANREEISKLEQVAPKQGSAYVGLFGSPASEQEFTIAWDDPESGGAIYDVRSHWDGFGAILFEFNIARKSPDLTPMSSSPIHVWAHQLRGGHVVIAFANVDEKESHGWAVLDAPVRDEKHWDDPSAGWFVQLIVLIIKAVHRAYIPGFAMSGAVYDNSDTSGSR